MHCGCPFDGVTIALDFFFDRARSQFPRYCTTARDFCAVVWFTRKLGTLDAQTIVRRDACLHYFRCFNDRQRGRWHYYYQLPTINYQLSTINSQLSTINYQLSTIVSRVVVRTD
ncbi:MAG: hypothetical protein HC849_12415 [Oscillatoriales cyanobacterium RU_3_3]|nr:hypothetical protein [Oscillatoriales cyanobacterium RU_3_3]NJR21911.1 hypothetical protein [Richelia sp. CSU_2_1]